MKYGLNDKPGLSELLLYGLQWWAVSLPCVIIMGAISSRLHFSDLAYQTFYLQKMFGIAGAATVMQIIIGHRLPLVIGPATILLVGLTASQSQSMDAAYSAIMISGLVLALTAASGLFTRLRLFFTPRIVAVILILIAFTLAPSILKLVFGPENEFPIFHLFFCFGLVAALIILNQILPGVWKSLTILFGLAGGCAVYFAVLGPPAAGQAAPASVPPFLFLENFTFDPGLIISFLLCMTALSINELGSIESIGHMLNAGDMPGRVKRGVGLQGLTNALSGALGIIGPVSFSLSAGVIAATGCATRYALIPAGFGLLLCSFSPRAVYWLSLLPGPVMGALLLYLMASQLASGLSMLVAEKGVSDFASGLTVAMPLMAGLMVSFTPAEVFAAFPVLVRPLIGNGFIVGAVTVVVLEHVVFKKK